jgi:hypothetical protein
MSVQTKQSLPELCYVVVPGAEPGRRMGLVKRGESGYYHCDYDQEHYSDEQVDEYVKLLNERLEVTPLLAECMLNGSMFGWHNRGADPEYMAKRLEAVRC